ncbi:DNA replication/repair protein RecF [Aeromicrobium sp. YIM 150415]|uniref:DNA replication/repair protein RecF n=1 Tax=Aeromicrobium sp. YIM 150415 TaxID=2803912 RepID=UPI001962A60F|nr:DNA replication/repair protein RecF [Aeromicrobium sp. YIM 150415]MBM9463850.1 DNA replication/repair protein RecF [Aeromicrobium sp. YIM 150415]
MHVRRLSLVDFRSYASVDIDLRPGATAFVGANGQGKTNLVEAVDYISRLTSHRVSGDAPLVRAGADQAIVRAEVVKDDRPALVEVEITPGRSNRARVNRNTVPRVRDLVGMVRSVIFSPEDLALVKGDPSDRRHFLDGLLVMRAPRLAGVKADYDRTLKQRNTLLKTARKRQVDLSTLEVWNESLARNGGELTAARLALLDELIPYATVAYQSVAAAASPDRREVSAAYRPAAGAVEVHERDPKALTDALLEEMDRRRRDELDRGVSLVGPHRDEVVLGIGELPAKGYASHGESWSLALALRLASYDLLRDEGDDPILILDDVFAELDQRRRDHLATLVSGAEQVLVTAAVDADVPEGLGDERFAVHAGKVTPA